MVWQTGPIWLHVGSDMAIMLAYLAIPWALIRLARLRRDMPYRWTAYLFAAFMFGRAATHGLAIASLAFPASDIEEGFRLTTSLMGLAAAAMLWRLVPRLIALPSPSQFDSMRSEVSKNIDAVGFAGQKLRDSDAALRGANAALEERVAARTADLRAALTERDLLLRTRYSIETELRSALGRAEKAGLAKSRFLAAMSHELRTPLNAVLGYARLLRLDGGFAPVQAARLDSVLQAATYLLGLINRVLDLTSIDTEQMVLRYKTVDLHAGAQTCLDLVRPMAEAKGLVLGFVAAPGSPAEIVTDPERLKQIVLNLLGNAVKFSSRGAVELRIEAQSAGGVLRVAVADNGPGIPADRQSKLFSNFERFDEHAPSAIEGAGLGLALSAKLATLMGGDVGYADNPLGGSLFWVDLPISPQIAAGRKPDTTNTPAAVSPDIVPVTARKLRLLMADDVPVSRHAASTLLLGAGHQVDCVEGGADAVAAATSGDFDVVLMDIRMPGMDGLEASRRIRRLPGARGKVPIIALTVPSQPPQLRAYRDAGITNYLTKPFTRLSLFDAVNRAAAGVTEDALESSVTFWP